MSHADLILKRANAMGLEVSDPGQIEELMRLEISSLSNASLETFDRELKIAVDCVESGLMEECDQFYRNWFGEPIGCAPPPDRCPPVWGMDD